MFKVTRSIVLTILLLIAAILFAGCPNSMKSESSTATTQASSTSTAASTGTTAETSTSDTAEPTTTTVETTATTTQGTAATTDATTSVAQKIDYRPQPADKDIRVDLNKDGIKEVIRYSCVDDYSYNLTLNGEAERFEGEIFLSGWFFLVDLDSVDRYLDIAGQELGPSDDYQVTFFYYDGSQLVKRGIVPGMICDAASDSIGDEPYGKGTIRLDGLGGLTARARGDVLHTWFFDEPWVLGVDGKLVKVHQDYYPMMGYDPDTGKLTPETKVVLKMDLPLLASPASSTFTATVKAGQTVYLVKTDNAEWVQLRAESGEIGWFQLSDYYRVLINGKAYFSDDVFSGLSFAD